MAEIEFAGESFVIAEKIGLMPLMRFAHLAKSGVDSNEMEGLVALYDLLRQCIANEDWDRFCDHAVTTRSGHDDLLAVVASTIEVLSARPTQQPSDSSPGLPTANVNSAEGSSLRVIRDLELQGRPSVGLMVRQAQESRASA